jgi:peptide/nickel transport system substrate-binding protein
MAKALGFGVGKPAYYPRWYQGMVGYDEALPKYPFDLNKAKQLMQEAGFPNGIDITMTEPSRSAEIRVAEVAQQMWAQAGIRVGIDAVERLAAIDKVKNYNFNVYQVRGTVVADPDLNSTYLLSGAAQNWTSYANKDFDKCMEEGRSNYDTAKRQEIYRRCQGFIYEDASLLTGFALPRNWVLSKSLKGFKVQWSNADLREAWLDK